MSSKHPPWKRLQRQTAPSAVGPDEEGFLYVLANPSMPGLVKVGKTRRPTQDRVGELSSATGVPTPFILLYEQPVEDCDAAEQWVHRQLEQGGYRNAASREFFSAPVHEVVRIVSLATAIRGFESDSPEAHTPSRTSAGNLGMDLFEMAMNAFDGTSTSLPNDAKGADLLKQAAACGFPSALEFLGNGYLHGAFGVKEDLNEALSIFLRAVEGEAWWCSAGAAQVFDKAGQQGRADEHWRKFFERAANESSAVEEKSERERALAQTRIGVGAIDYCIKVAMERRVPAVPIATLVAARPAVMRLLDKYIAGSVEDDDDRNYWERRRAAIEQYFEGSPEAPR